MGKTEKSRSAHSTSSQKARLWIIIISIVVFVAAVATIATFLIIDAYKKDSKFDYLTSRLDKYVTHEVDYKEYKFSIDIAKPHVQSLGTNSRVDDVEVAILNLLASKSKVVGDGAYSDNGVIGPGDKVKIWYRGYLTHPETGAEIEVDGMCNFGSTDSLGAAKPAELQIGSGAFVPGFELSLVGVDTSSYAKFERIQSGAIDQTKHVIYIEYERIVGGKTEKGSHVRFDLTKSDLGGIDGKLGAGFFEKIKDFKIGEEHKFDLTDGSTTYQYTKVKIQYATTCENKATNGGKDILVVDCYFPYDYGTLGSASAQLRNEYAKFEVYVGGVQDHTAPELNEDFIKEQLASEDSLITLEELNEYEGSDLVAKYKDYAEKYLIETYEEAREALIEEQMWSHYLNIFEIKRYPGVKVDPIVSEYVDDVYKQFDASGGTISNSSTGSSKTYENVDEYAVAYLGLAEGADWREHLEKMAKSLVAERLILYYLMQAEDLAPTAAELEAEIASIKAEYLEEYVNQWIAWDISENNGKKRSEYSADEYAAMVAEREAELYAYYDDEYFTETAHYEIVLRELITYPDVTDLDTKGAYPYEETK